MIVKRSKSYYEVEDSLNFSIRDLEDITVPEVTDKGVKRTPFKSLSPEKQRMALNEINETVNSIYLALNGEKKAIGEKIKDFVGFTINEGTFSTVFSTAVEFFMLDYIRPQTVLTNLLATTIPVSGGANRSIIAAVRGIGMVRVNEVPRNGTLPTFSPSLDEYVEQMSYDVKRYGIKVEVDKDLKDSDEWGILGFLLAAVADGFRFRKEYEVIRMLNLVGRKLIDNSAPNTGSLGVHSSGRGIDGSFNGTLSMEDLRKAFGYASMRGHEITTLILHPLAVFNLFGDSELGQMLNTARLISTPQANPFTPGWDHPFGDLGTVMRIFGGSNVAGPTPGSGFPPGIVPNFGEVGVGGLGIPGVDPTARSVNTLSAYSVLEAQGPYGPLTVIVTSLVPIRRVTVAGRERLVTNVYLVSRQKPIAILQEKNPTMVEWEDLEKEVSIMAFTEKYAILPVRQGRGVYTLKNIVIDRNYYVAPSYQVTFTGGSLAEPGTSGIVP